MRVSSWWLDSFLWAKLGIVIDSDEGISARKMMIDTLVILKRINALFRLLDNVDDDEEGEAVQV